MTQREIEKGDAEEFYTILDIDGDDLILKHHHTSFGTLTDESGSSIRGFIENMNNGEWVWV